MCSDRRSFHVIRYLDNDFIVSVQCFLSTDVRPRIPNIDSNKRLQINRIKRLERLNDLKERDGDEELLIENPERKQTYIKVSKLIQLIEENNFAISANGVIFRTDKRSVLATILDKWFDERVEYKGYMKKAYKESILKSHPDKGGDPEEFRMYREAWEYYSS